MSEEWRVVADLDDEEHGHSLGERLRAFNLDDEARERLGGRAIVTRDGPRLFVYTESEQGAREAERVLGELLAEDELTGEVSVSRWHPDAEEWKDPSVPMPETEEERRREYEEREATARREAAETGRMPYEVSVELPLLEDVTDLAESVAAEGYPVHRRWRHLLIGVPTEERANELADRLRSELADDAEITIEAHDVRYPTFVLLGWPN